MSGRFRDESRKRMWERVLWRVDPGGGNVVGEGLLPLCLCFKILIVGYQTPLLTFHIATVDVWVWGLMQFGNQIQSLLCGG